MREYHFLRALALRGEVTYLHFAEPGVATFNGEDLPFCREVIAIPKPAAYGPWNMVQGVAGRWPLPILNYTSAAMTAAVQRVTGATRYDLFHLDSIHMIRYAEAFPPARVMYNWHNIESEAMERFSATVPSKAKRWYAHLTAGKLQRLERKILQSHSGHIVCSEREFSQLRETAPQTRVAVVQNGVDTQYFANAGGGSGPRRDLLFVGSMDYYPNAEAATSFSRNVWPVVRERMPHARLLIVGANPGPGVLSLAELPGVTVTGTVPDVRPFYGGALAAIVPLRSGGGTRLKILEAMAAGVPVISTPLGAEGLQVTSGREILLAGPDDAEKWMAQLQRLADPASHQRQALVTAALDLVRTKYDWEALGATLWSTYQGWLPSEG